MYYVIDAVRWGGNGHISHVKWHPVELQEQDLKRGESKVVPVIHAAQVCGEQEVRVYVDGDVGRFFRMKACDDGLDAEVDEQGTPLHERLSHLPAF